MAGFGDPQIETVDAAGLKLGIVGSRWHADLIDHMIDRAQAAAAECGVTDVLVHRVAGAVELPLVAQALAAHCDAVVALGVVIKGETQHFEYVCQSVTSGLTRVALDSRTPVGNGVLTCTTMEQAVDRAGGRSRDAQAAVEQWLAKQPKVSGAAAQPQATRELMRFFDAAEKAAEKAGDSFVTVERMLLALAVEKETEAGRILAQAGVTAHVDRDHAVDAQGGDAGQTLVQQRGVRGVVLGCGVRDVADLREMRFPVWSRAVSAQGTVKATAGAVNVPVVLGGQTIHPGDVVVADDDGVMVVPRGDVPRALRASRARVEKEEASRAAFREGELGLDRYGLRERLPDLGIEYVDYEEYRKENGGA